MSNEQDHILSVKILERSYKVKCASNEAAGLEEAANYVNDQMRKIRSTGSVTNTDRIAVVTALNIAHEFLQLKQQNHGYIDIMTQRIGRLQDKIQQALSEEETIEA